MKLCDFDNRAQRVPTEALGGSAASGVEAVDQRACSAPSDATFLEHWKLHAVCVEAEVRNLRVVSGLLLAEIVGREARYDQCHFSANLAQILRLIILQLWMRLLSDGRA